MTDIEKNLPLLETHSLFAGLSRQEIREAAEFLGGCIVKFNKGDCINEFMDRLYPRTFACILSGWSLLIKYDAWGNQAILDFAMPGYLLGCYSVLTDVDYSNIRMTATSPGTLLCLNAELLLDNGEIQRNPLLAKLCKNIMRLLAQRSWRLLKKADIVSAHSLREKILAFLDSQREICRSDSFEIPLDRQGLADYLYVNRSALSRELSRLREEGLIDFRKSRFTLLFPPNR